MMMDPREDSYDDDVDDDKNITTVSNTTPKYIRDYTCIRF